jgi:hypothetical protein
MTPWLKRKPNVIRWTKLTIMKWSDVITMQKLIGENVWVSSLFILRVQLSFLSDLKFVKA